MSRKRQIKRLARMLGRSRSAAEQFVEQINQALLEMTGSTVSIGQICSATSAMQNTPITVDGVLERLGYKKATVTPGDPTPIHHLGQEALRGWEREQELGVQPDISPVPEELDIESCQQQALALLVRLQAGQVTYVQLEDVMTKVGLDPDQHEDSYNWLLEQLEQHGVLVVDRVTDASESVEDLKTDAIKYSREISQGLRRILASSDDQQLLTEEEQRRLLEIYRSGRQAQKELAEQDETLPDEIKQALHSRVADGEKALETLLWRNRRLVASVVLKYGRSVHHLEFDDLFQEGMLGLQKAIERFDLEMGHRLSTYATWWIRQAITRAIADQERMIRFPVHVVETINQYRKAYGELSLELDREPTELEIAARMNRLSPRTLAQITECLNQDTEVPDFMRKQIDEAIGFVRKVRSLGESRMISLNQEVRDETGSELGDLLPDQDTESPEDTVMRIALQSKIREALSRLPKRQEQVLILRFGLNGDEEMTLEEVGQRFGVTRERIRQIQEKALCNLQRPLQILRLKDFYEE